MGTLVGSWQSSTMPSAYRPPFAAKTHSYSSFFFSGENCNFPFYIFWSSMLQGCTTNHLEIPLSARIFRSEIGKRSKMEKWKQAYLYIFWNRPIQTTRLLLVSNQQFADIKMDLEKLFFNHIQCICSLIISRVLSKRRHWFLSLLIDVAGGARLLL